MSATLTFVTTAPTRTYAEGEDPFLFRRVRTWWTILALFLMAQGNGLFTRQDTTYWSVKTIGKGFESVSFSLLLTVVLWVICLGLMVKQIAPTLRLMLKQKAVLAFGVLGLLSTLWSQDPQFTFRKATLWFLGFAFAWFFATYYSPVDQMRLFLTTGIIVALACIAMAILLPEYGISSNGEWKGVFTHKNRMGLGIFFLFSGLPFCRISGGRRMLTLGFQAVLPVGLILLSQSRTSLIMTFVLVAVRIVGPWIASRRRDQLPFALYATAIGTSLTALAISLGREIILTLLGRDASMTGRTEHWAVLLPYMLRHLLLGYGFSGFWLISGDSLKVINIVGGAMKGSDSGYVDTMLQLGLVGMGLLLIILLGCVRDCVKLLRIPSAPLAAYWYAGVLLAMIIGSLTEILFLVPIGIFTFMFVLASSGLRDSVMMPPR